MPTTEKSVYFL